MRPRIGPNRTTNVHRRRSPQPKARISAPTQQERAKRAKGQPSSLSTPWTGRSGPERETSSVREGTRPRGRAPTGLADSARRLYWLQSRKPAPSCSPPRDQRTFVCQRTADNLRALRPHLATTLWRANDAVACRSNHYGWESGAASSARMRRASPASPARTCRSMGKAPG